MIIECDDKVYNPLGGGSYVFEKDIVKFLMRKFTKDNIVIGIGAQPNSSPHFGTLIVFSTAFSLAKKMKIANPTKHIKILFEVVDTAPSEIIEINKIKYQKSLKNTGIINNNLDDYLEILEYFKNQQLKNADGYKMTDEEIEKLIGIKKETEEIKEIKEEDFKEEQDENYNTFMSQLSCIYSSDKLMDYLSRIKEEKSDIKTDTYVPILKRY